MSVMVTLELPSCLGQCREPMSHMMVISRTEGGKTGERLPGKDEKETKQAWA